ncbi:MAG: IS630 family transposase [Thermoanaerobaculia bacterium]
MDESGLLMSPLVRRSWAPCGVTPVLHQRGRHRGKVSIIGAVVCTPAGLPIGYLFRLHVDENVTKSRLAAFVRQLRRHYRKCPLVIVWDRLNSHRSPEIARYARTHAIDLELLPAYAPELNPVEYSWAHLECNPLANYAPRETAELARTSRRAGRAVQRRQSLIRSFLAPSPLFF